VQDRIDLENYYASNIERINYNISTIVDKSTLSQSLITIRSYNTIKSEQSRTLINSLKTEVHTELQRYFDAMGEQMKSIMSTTKRLDKNFKANLDKLDSVKSQYAKNSRDLDDAQLINQHIQGLADLALEKKVKTAERAYNLTKEMSQSEYLLKSQIDIFNVETMKMTEEYQTILTSYRKLEEERLQVIHDCLMKTVVFEISYMRNLQYDIERIGKVHNPHLPHLTCADVEAARVRHIEGLRRFHREQPTSTQPQETVIR
jgi:hypothetical protein